MKFEDIDFKPYTTVLLDRDGTINRQRQGDYVKTWDEFEFLPGVLEKLAEISKTAKHIIIVTNQRGVGRGRLTEEQLADIHTHMIEEIQKNGGRIDHVFFSAGLTDDDPTRKPNIGMWQQILLCYPDIDKASTIMVGDGDCDMKFAKNCGIKSMLVDKQRVIFIQKTTE